MTRGGGKLTFAAWDDSLNTLATLQDDKEGSLDDELNVGDD